MQIIHKIGNFLFTIFPELSEGNPELIIETLEKYYTYGPYKPIVTINEGWIKIEIDEPTIISQEADYKKVISFSEKGRYSEAKPILQKLIEKNPTNSEYHRVLGQILSDEGDQEEAINSLIDALRWDSKNGWALLMMGNILSKFKNDVPTAMKYYDQAKLVNPTDHIVLNNIAQNLFQEGKLEEAKEYFYEVLKINSDYPNSHLALGMIAEKEGDLHVAFYSTIQSIKTNNKKDVLFQNSVKIAFDIAKKIIATDDGERIFKEFKHKLEFEGGTEIEIVEDNGLTTAAKIEFAENYNRTKHIVRFKPSYPAVEHLIMHELTHLDFVIEARKTGINQLFYATQNHKSEFMKGLELTIKKFRKMGIPEDSIDKYCSGLFDGLNLQIYNAPIDLFIENFLYNEFSELRPYQFLSLYSMIQDGIKAVTDKKIIELSPKDILSKSKVYNIINAIQFKELFGLDLTKEFTATATELKMSQGFYDEFLQYREDKEPGEEYELIIHWAEDLKLEKNFELENEVNYRKRTNVDSLLKSLEVDPFGLNEKDPSKERDMEKFRKTQEEVGTNMAVVMFMVDALKYFEGMPKKEIKKIAVDIAMQGTQGYRPDKKDYKVNSIPDKVFSGYQILAYYYVSFSIAVPEMLSQMGLPYDEEYKLATSMYKPK